MDKRKGGVDWPLAVTNFVISLFSYNKLQSWKTLIAKLQKIALYLTPEAMYNQFKRPSAGSVSELHYTYRKT